MNVYKSKIGLELIIPLSLAFGFTIFSLINENKGWLPLLLIGLLISAIVYLLISIKYIVENTTLIIKCGFIYKIKIDIFDIRIIEETRNPISSPAASLDRLEIYYGKFDSVIISPKDKHAFIDELTRINSNIEVKYRK